MLNAANGFGQVILAEVHKYSPNKTKYIMLKEN